MKNTSKSLLIASATALLGPLANLLQAAGEEHRRNARLTPRSGFISSPKNYLKGASPNGYPYRVKIKNPKIAAHVQMMHEKWASERGGINVAQPPTL